MDMQRIDQRPEIRLRADFRIEPIAVDDVVAVRRTRARLHDRRCVDMADAERRQIWHEGGRVAKREVAMELQAIGSPNRRKAVGALAHQAAERSRASSHKAATRIAQPRLSRILRLKSCRISVVRRSGRAAAAKAAMRSTAERVSTPSDATSCLEKRRSRGRLSLIDP